MLSRVLHLFTSVRMLGCSSGIVLTLWLAVCVCWSYQHGHQGFEILISFTHLSVFHGSNCSKKKLVFERMACDRDNNRRSCRHLAYGIILTLCLSFAMGAGEATPSRHLSFSFILKLWMLYELFLSDLFCVQNWTTVL